MCLCLELCIYFDSSHVSALPCPVAAVCPGIVFIFICLFILSCVFGSLQSLVLPFVSKSEPYSLFPCILVPGFWPCSRFCFQIDYVKLSACVLTQMWTTGFAQINNKLNMQSWTLLNWAKPSQVAKLFIFYDLNCSEKHILVSLWVLNWKERTALQLKGQHPVPWISTQQTNGVKTFYGISTTVMFMLLWNLKLSRWHCHLTAPGVQVQSWAHVTVCVEFRMFSLCPWVSLWLYGFTPSPNKHISRWICDAKLTPDVNECVNVC